MITTTTISVLSAPGMAHLAIFRSNFVIWTWTWKFRSARQPHIVQLYQDRSRMSASICMGKSLMIVKQKWEAEWRFVDTENWFKSQKWCPHGFPTTELPVPVVAIYQDYWDTVAISVPQAGDLKSSAHLSAWNIIQTAAGSSWASKC